MNGSTVFSYMGPSMAAAIVAHTANRTADLAILLSGQHHSHAGASAKAITDIPAVPLAAEVERGRREDRASARLAAFQRRVPMKLSAPDIDLDASIGGFARDFLLSMDELFPGLREAAIEALRRAGKAIWEPVGHYYSEPIDRGTVDATDARALHEAYETTREVMNAAAAGKHRFLPGDAQERIATIRGASAEAGITTAAKAYTDNVEKEYALRLQLAREALDAQAQTISGFADAISEALNRKRAAEAGIANAMVSVIGDKIDTNILRFAQKARIDQIITQAASEFTQVDVGEATTRDFSAADWKAGRAVFDQYSANLAAHAATLYNQLRGNAGLSSSDQDITEYEVL